MRVIRDRIKSSTSALSIEIRPLASHAAANEHEDPIIVTGTVNVASEKMNEVPLEIAHTRR
jgi:hypothetical protein